MIEKLWFKNLKALADVEIPLERLTVLVGANGSGKSTVLDGANALAQATAVARGPLILDDERDDLGKNDQLWPSVRTRRATSEDVVLGVQLRGAHALELHGPSRQIVLDGPEGKAIVTTDSSELVRRLAGDSFGALGSAALLRLDPSRIASASYSEAESPQLRSDGYGLATLLAWMAGNEPASKQNVEQSILEIVPRARRLRTPRKQISVDVPLVVTVDNVRTEQTRKQVVAADVLELEIDGIGWIPAEHLSAGTLVAMAIVTLLNSPNRPRLILLDEIEHGFHPGAQRALMGVLKNVLDRTFDLQIIAATHSPFIVDAVKPESVRVMKLDTAGHAHCKKLTDHPEWPKWKGTMLPGEMWSWAGEDWVFGAGE